MKNPEKHFHQRLPEASGTRCPALCLLCFNQKKPARLDWLVLLGPDLKDDQLVKIAHLEPAVPHPAP